MGCRGRTALEMEMPLVVAVPNAPPRVSANSAGVFLQVPLDTVVHVAVSAWYQAYASSMPWLASVPTLTAVIALLVRPPMSVTAADVGLTSAVVSADCLLVGRVTSGSIWQPFAQSPKTMPKLTAPKCVLATDSW